MKLDQVVTSKTTPAARRKAARIARGYSLEDLAVATGLTASEIAAAEESGGHPPEHHVDRIEHALK